MIAKGVLNDLIVYMRVNDRNASNISLTQLLSISL